MLIVLKGYLKTTITTFKSDFREKRIPLIMLIVVWLFWMSADLLHFLTVNLDLVYFLVYLIYWESDVWSRQPRFITTLVQRCSL